MEQIQKSRIGRVTHSLQIICKAEDPIAISLTLGILGFSSWHLHLTDMVNTVRKFSETQIAELYMLVKIKNKVTYFGATEQEILVAY